MSQNDLEGPGSEDNLPRWQFPLAWFSLVAVGWALYELTSQPAIAVTAVCLKFGWEDFLTARWLRRTDPDPRRGRACFWLYLASGLWKTAIVGLLMTLAYLYLLRGPAPAPNPLLWQALAGTWLTALVGCGLSTLATTSAIWLAWRGGIKLWLNANVHRARRRDYWPPSLLARGAENRMGRLLFTAVVLGYIPLILGGGLLIGSLLSQFLKGGVVGGLILYFMFLVSIAVISDFQDRGKRIAAKSPFECWELSERREEFSLGPEADPGRAFGSR
jgi:hypothetical protein